MHDTLSEQDAKPLSWPWIVGLSLAGLMMGLLTSLVGMPQGVEFSVWMGCYVVWLVLVVWQQLRPFVTLLVASVLSGVWTGTTQYLLRDHYVANNPWYADQIAEQGGVSAPAVIGFALVAGTVFGLVLGGGAWAVTRFRARKS